MASKVLVADDSLTIQKVIGITLASSGYELVECLNEKDLLSKIQSTQFDLVLLDFNLSETNSGYDLSKKIHQLNPNAAIIVMLGTFDSVDESQFHECGISDKIVKPFESNKFIKKCRDLLSEDRASKNNQFVSEGPIKKSEETVDEVVVSGVDNIDLWQVDAPQMVTKDFHTETHEIVEELISTQELTLDPLSSEIEGWGFTSGASLEEKFQKVFPPVINETSDSNILGRLQTSSQFASEQEFNEIKINDQDETDPSFEIPEDLNRNLLNEIEEDVSAEAFWAVDEIVPRKSEEESDIESSNLDEVTADLTDKVKAFQNIESLEKSHPTEQTAVIDLSSTVNQDELVDKLKNAFKPIIEEMVKEFCRQTAEKVAWEVIPDLAENLIRKEIRDISNSIQD